MELETIRNLKIKSDDVETARQLFLFQCASGISYADLMKLEDTDIQQIDGVWYVAKSRTKTGVKYTSVILPEGVEILKLWGYKVPRKSNQKYNLSLLKIETMAGLKKHLHSHLGRKVYGTTLLRNGVAMKTVSKSLGHSTTQVTESTYAFLQSEDVVKEISKKMCV
jgi:integrase